MKTVLTSLQCFTFSCKLNKKVCNVKTWYFCHFNMFGRSLLWSIALLSCGLFDLFMNTFLSVFTLLQRHVFSFWRSRPISHFSPLTFPYHLSSSFSRSPLISCPSLPRLFSVLIYLQFYLSTGSFTFYSLPVQLPSWTIQTLLLPFYFCLLSPAIFPPSFCSITRYCPPLFPSPPCPGTRLSTLS